MWFPGQSSELISTTGWWIIEQKVAGRGVGWWIIEQKVAGRGVGEQSVCTQKRYWSNWGVGHNERCKWNNVSCTQYEVAPCSCLYIVVPLLSDVHFSLGVIWDGTCGRGWWDGPRQQNSSRHDEWSRRVGTTATVPPVHEYVRNTLIIQCS